MMQALLVLLAFSDLTELAFQRQPVGVSTLNLDIRTTSGTRYVDTSRREADHLVVSPNGKTIAVWSDVEAGVLVGSPSKGFKRYLVSAPPTDEHLTVPDKYALPKVAWCFDGQAHLLAFFPDSRLVERLDLSTGRARQDEFTRSARIVPEYEPGDSGNSGCKMRLAPGGKLAAVSIGSRIYANETEHDTATYLISSNGSEATYLGLGSPVAWVDAKHVLIWHSRGDSGDLSLVDWAGKLVAKREHVAIAAVSARRELYVYELAYSAILDDYAKFFRIGLDLQNYNSGSRKFALHGAHLRGMRSDTVAVLEDK